MESLLNNLRRNKKVLWPLNVPHPQEVALATSHIAIFRHKVADVKENPAFEYINKNELYLNELVKKGKSIDAGGGGGGKGSDGGGKLLQVDPNAPAQDESVNRQDTEAIVFPRSADWSGLAEIKTETDEINKHGKAKGGGLAPGFAK
jgi:hypothetical protein